MRSLGGLAASKQSVTAGFTTGREVWEMSITQHIRTLLASEDGPTAVEYAVMLAMIIIVCVAAIQILGLNTANQFQDMADRMPTGS